MVKKVYYTHAKSLYNTPQEKIDLETLDALFPDAEVVNPNSQQFKDGFKDQGPDYSKSVIATCDVLSFRSLPHGKITAGAYEEILFAKEKRIPVIELPCLAERGMSVEDTRLYLADAGYR